MNREHLSEQPKEYQICWLHAPEGSVANSPDEDESDWAVQRGEKFNSLTDLATFLGKSESELEVGKTLRTDDNKFFQVEIVN